MARFLQAVLCLLFADLAMGFKNPIIPGFNPDPSITRVGEDYFLVTSSFEFYPGVPVYHSKDLIKWDVIGHALNRRSQLDLVSSEPSGGVFAPTIRYHSTTKTFYMIVTVVDHGRALYVSSKNIWDEKAWSDPIWVDQQGIDPDLFFDDDGKVWLTTAYDPLWVDPSYGYAAIWISQIDLKTGSSLTESRLLHLSTLEPPESVKLAEGSHIYKKDKFYYLMTAEGGTEYAHRETIKRSRSLDGPWEENPNNPILFNGRNMSQPILATGHADLVSTPSGDWYMVFLAARPQNPQNSAGLNQLGRETFLAPVKWVDGWPVVNDGNLITSDMPGLYNLKRPKVWRDEFDGKLKDKEYYTARTPTKPFHSLDARPGWLRIRGNVHSLSEKHTPAALLRKQVDLEVIWSTELDFQPTSSRHEAGVVVYLSPAFHDEIGVTRHPADETRRVVFARTASGENVTISTVYEDIPKQGTVKLFIRALRDKYELGYSVGQGDPKYIAGVENKWLQWKAPNAVIGGVFTGTFFGVYAHGARLPILIPADFKYIQTELIEA